MSRSSFPRPRVDVDGDRPLSLADLRHGWRPHRQFARPHRDHTQTSRGVSLRREASGAVVGPGRSRKRSAWSPERCGRTLTPGRSAAALTITMAVGQHNETSAPAGRAAAVTRMRSFDNG